MKTEQPKDFTLDMDILKKASLVYRALNNKLRQKLISFIHEKGQVNVTTIYKRLRIEQSVASQQLGILRKENIVKTEKEGRTVFYSLNYNRLKEVEKISHTLLNKK